MTKKELTKQLEDIRKEKDLTMYRVMKDGEIGSNTAYGIQSGEADYTIGSLLKYLKGLGVKIYFK